jgi:hypothetical protein
LESFREGNASILVGLEFGNTLWDPFAARLLSLYLALRFGKNPPPLAPIYELPLILPF